MGRAHITQRLFIKDFLSDGWREGAALTDHKQSHTVLCRRGCGYGRDVLERSVDILLIVSASNYAIRVEIRCLQAGAQWGLVDCSTILVRPCGALGGGLRGGGMVLIAQRVKTIVIIRDVFK